MIRHCVFIRFRADVSAGERTSIFDDIAALREKIPGIVAVHSGPSVSPEGFERGFDSGFIVDFEGSSARDRYLADPDHAKAGGRIVAAAEGGLDGIFVFDLEVPG